MRYSNADFASGVSLVARMVLCVAFAGSSLLALWVLFGGAGQLFGHELAFYGIVDMRPCLWSGILAGLAWFLAVIGLSCLPFFPKLSRENVWLNGGIVLLLAFGVRIVFLLTVGNGLSQVNDNQIAWDMAIGGKPGDDYLLWIPRWMVHTLILRWISHFFGDSQTVAAMVGVVFTSVTAVAVLLIGRELTGSMFRARVAALAYALFPAGVAYSIVCTPEHFACACFASSAFCLLLVFRSENARRMMAWAIAGGLLLGLGHSVKPLSLIFLFAFALALYSKVLDGTRCAWIKAGTLFATVAATQFVISSGMLRLSEREFGLNLADKRSSAHMLVVGLNRHGEGQIHIGKVSRIVPTMMAQGATIEEASRAGLKALRDDWSGHLSEAPSFLAKKAIWAWQDFNTPFRFISVMRGDLSGLEMRGLPKFLPPMSQMLYLLLVLSAVCAALRAGGRTTAFAFRYIVFVILGYFCISMLIEGQSRYKCIVLPYMFCLVSCLRFRDGAAGAHVVDSVKSLWHGKMPVRFLVTGIWNFVFGYFVFAGLFWAFYSTWPAWLIVVVANVIGITNAFVSHRQITYRSTGVWWREYLRFYVVYGIQLLLNVALIYAFVTRLGWNGYAVQFVVSIVLTLLSYWLHNCYSFRKETSHDAEK